MSNPAITQEQIQKAVREELKDSVQDQLKDVVQEELTKYSKEDVTQAVKTFIEENPSVFKAIVKEILVEEGLINRPKIQFAEDDEVDKLMERSFAENDTVYRNLAK